MESANPEATQTALASASQPKAKLVRGALKKRAYDELKQRLLRGEFEPGSYLSERQLSGMLAMSKTPIRAAVERLEVEGFVTVAPQQGIMVRELSAQEIADQFEIRVALESFVLRTLAGRLTPPQIEQIKANLDAQRANLEAGDIRLHGTLDTDFHLLFCQFLGNQEILLTTNRLRDKIQRAILRVYEQNPVRIRSSIEEHHAIADAVIQADPMLAVQRIEDHLEYGKDFLLSTLQRGGLNS